MDESEALIGRTLGGTFRIDRRLGAGGMGAVYAATHLRTGRRYAVKVLLPEVAARRDSMARFKREADAIGALGHANIVAIHDFAEDGGLAYLVMDLLEGEDLASRLDRKGMLPLDEALAIFSQIASGLEAAHARGLVHRDLKPANVFLARQPGAPERAVLLDFGLARSFAYDSDFAKLTASGIVLGTPQYMSPEQASGEPLDARADLYSLATILYEMLSGGPPFTAPTLPALFAKLVADPPPLLSSARSDLPPALTDVLARALAKHPDERYPDVPALRSAIESAISGQPITNAYVPHTSARPLARPERAKKSLAMWLFAGGGLFLACAACTGAIGALALFLPAAPAPEPIAAVPAVPVEEVVVDPPPAPPPVEPLEPVEVETPEPVERPRPRVIAPPREARPPEPPGGPPPGGPPEGVREATDRMAVRDWRGCIDATHRAPRSAAILGARMSCALQANDNAELRDTCAELRQHYPEHSYTSTCEQMLATRR